MPSAEEMKSKVREFDRKIFNEHDVAYIKDSVADGFVEYSPAPGMTPDRDGLIATLEGMLRAMPDMRSEILDLIASGNKVAVRSRFTGTDTGGFMPGAPPTGKQATAESIDVVEFDEEGKMTSHYGIMDMIGVMTQLGLMPSPGQ
jgi:predicted ester cyclase